MTENVLGRRISVGVEGVGVVGGVIGMTATGGFSGVEVTQAEREIATKTADASRLARISDIGDSNLCGLFL